MSFYKVKSWDNRKTAEPGDCTNGRTWTRRITWLENGEAIKLKLELCNWRGDVYREVLPDKVDADKIWKMFKCGTPIDDCIAAAFSAQRPPEYLQSKKESER